MPIIERGSIEGGLGSGVRGMAVGFYDFAVDGGVVGDIVLRGAAQIPAGAVIVDAGLRVRTALAGASATAALKVEGAADLNSADAISGAPWSTTGAKRVDFTATTAPILTTTTRTITLTVGTAALTAGKFTVWVEYVLV